MRELKAAYSVAELAELSGLSADQIGRIADQAGLCGERAPKKKRWIWLSQLKERCPDLWQSILDRVSAMKATGRAFEGDGYDDEDEPARG